MIGVVEEMCMLSRFTCCGQGDVHKKLIYRSIYLDSYGRPPVCLFFLKLGINLIFFRLFYTSTFCQTVLNSDAIGSTMANLNQKALSDISIPIPSLEEQKGIVRRVDKLFAIADKLEKRCQNAKAKVNKLSQSVLAKAFRGELVPHDQNDEPAEKLLERIQQEKAKMEAELKKSKMRTRKKKSSK